MWNSIKTWFSAHGGPYHVVAGAWIALFTAYGAVPAFHQLVIDIWAKTPPFFHEAVPAVTGLIAWYTSTRKTSP